MNDLTEDRINRLLLTLSVEAAHLDLVQIRNFLLDLVTEAYGEERQRVLALFDGTFHRIYTGKGKPWRSELETLRNEIDYGHQILFTVEGAD